MASPVIAPLPPSVVPAEVGVPLGLRPIDRALRRWPRRAEHRWLLRIALGLPMVVVALVISGRQPRGVLNETIATASRSIHWGAGDMEWIGNVWPPIPVGLAGLVHGNLIALSVLGALATGGILQSVAERMVLRGWPTWTVVLALVTLAATPPMVFLSTTDLAEFLGMVLLAIAMNGFLRFAVHGRTEGGYSAGLLLGIATACTAAAPVHALAMAAAAPLIARHRYRDQRGAGWATAAVLAFPSVAAIGCWMFLEWRFTGHVLTAARASGAFAFPDGVGRGLVKALIDMGEIVALAPVLWVSFALLIQRSRLAAFGMLAPIPGLVLTLWLGLRPYSGLAIVVISCLALFSVVSRPSRATQLVMAGALVVQWVLTVLVTTRLIGPVAAWWQLVR